jgi:DNA polymerase III delta prime subunit
MELFPSTLFISSDNVLIQTNINQICLQLNNKISPNNPDIFIMDSHTGWTIELTRSVKNWLSQKPFNHSNKIIIIYQADQLNTESQNALLKSLEEPGTNNYFILTTGKPSKIVSTITSRCQIIKLKNTNQFNQSAKPINLNQNIKQSLFQSEIISQSKDQVLPYLENQLKIYQQLILKNPNSNNSQIIQKIMKAIHMIDNNVDPRSALDSIFLP